MSERLEHLLDEFVVRFRRGENPDLREYLARAGDDGDQLARLVDVFLESVPAPPTTAERLALSRAWAEADAPLHALRLERRLRREQVVGALADALGVANRKKLALRYHELETGQLEPAAVDRRVWDALSGVLRARVDDLVAWTRPAHAHVPRLVFYRLADAASAPRDAVPTEEADEIDELFGVGRSAH